MVIDLFLFLCFFLVSLMESWNTYRVLEFIDFLVLIDGVGVMVFLLAINSKWEVCRSKRYKKCEGDG